MALYRIYIHEIARWLRISHLIRRGQSTMSRTEVSAWYAKIDMAIDRG